MKKQHIIIRILSIITACALFAGNFTYAHDSEKTDVNALCKAYILMEATTNEVLYQYCKDLPMPVTSLSKMMILLLLAEQIEKNTVSLDDEVQCSAEVVGVPGAIIWLENGEKMKLSDLTKAICISSANDASLAVAEYLGGNQSEFLALMNARAEELGMTHTRFTNIVGYDEENNCSTAYDMALLSSALMKYEYFDGYMTTRLDYVRADTDRTAQLLNTNRLASYYKGIRGIKAGKSDNAGYCIAACAENNGMTLVAVALGCGEDMHFEAAEYLLDKGFSEYELFTPTVDYLKLPDIPVSGGVTKKVAVSIRELKSCIIPKGKKGSVTYRYTLLDLLSAEVFEGQTVGEYTVFLGEKILYSSDIITKKEVSELTYFICLKRIFGGFFG